MKPSPCICTNLRQAALASTALYDRMLAPAGLKVTMFRLLRNLSDVPDITITDLATRLGLDRSTLGRNLRVLERRALVKVTIGTDGRARKVTLTSAGHAAVMAAIPLWDKAQKHLANQIGDDAGQLLATLGKLADIPNTLDGQRNAS